MSDDADTGSGSDPLEKPPASPDPIVQWQPSGHRVSQRGAAVGGVASVAVIAGSLAVGALAIGALAIGSLAIGRARIRRLEIDELVVRRVVGLD